MKKVLFICLVLIGIPVQAQPGPDKELKRKEMKEKMADLTPQQRAELKAKKMALHLNLNEAQQSQIQTLLLDRENKIAAMRANKKDRKELSKDELFELKSQRLDEQIAFKKELESILTEEQFAKFEKSRMGRGKMRKQQSRRNKE